MGFVQDITTILDSGETSEEEQRRKEMEQLSNWGYDWAGHQIGEQYLGPVGDKLKRLQEIDDLLNNTYGGPQLTSEERAKFQAERDTLTREIETTTKYTPKLITPTTSYDVERYTPEEMEAVTEASLRGPKREYVADFEDAVMQDPSVAALAKADPYGLKQQRNAIGALRDVYERGGLTAVDRARLDEIRRRNQMMERASREAIVADLERRGQSGSGVELASRLSNQQGSAERMQQEGLGVEALAEERQLQAMLNAGMLGRELAQDVYGREYETGAAQDVVNATNTTGAREVQAAERESEQNYLNEVMAGWARDADRLTNASETNTARATEANKWGAEAQTNANLWGANAGNLANLTNVGLLNDAQIAAINQAGGNISGWNTGQMGLGNLALGKVGAFNTIEANRPMADYGAAVGKAIELTKTGYSGGKAVRLW